MSNPDPPLSPDILERARAYVHVDQNVVDSLPALGDSG
jgi:hypothetical protein